MRASGRDLIPMMLLLVALLAAGCGTGSGSSSHVQTVSRPVSGVSAVTFTGYGQISIQQTGQEKLTITAQANLIPQVTTTVSGNRLTIGYNGTPPTNVKAIGYALQVKQLSDIEVKGTGHISAGSLTEDTMTVSLSGAGAAVKLSGRAQDQQVTISGGGTYEGSNFASTSGTVVIQGAGTALVDVVASLNAQITGVGVIEYLGNPSINKTISGTGTVKPAGAPAGQ